MKQIPFIELYRSLIGFNTISAFNESLDVSNRGLIDHLGNLFGDIGFSINIQKVPHSRNKYNLLAQIGSGEGGLLLSGHTDTVPCDEHLWQSCPFTLLEKDDRLYGLGTCDMKGFFAFIYQALQDIPLDKLTKPMYILATADEETSMAGARFFYEQQLIKPDAAIIGEPTELRPINKHKGHFAQQIDIEGKSGHSSDPKRGVNAIEIMHQAISSLIDLKTRIANDYRDGDFAVPESTLNLGHIHGGDGENRICGHCHLTFDVRPVPELDAETTLYLIDEALSPLKLKYPDRINNSLMYPPVGAFSSRSENQLLETAEALTGFSISSANYSTEAPFISALGCDTLVLGPGSINQAHQPNEYIDLSYVDPTVRILQQLIKNYCL